MSQRQYHKSIICYSKGSPTQAYYNVTARLVHRVLCYMDKAVNFLKKHGAMLKES